MANGFGNSYSLIVPHGYGLPVLRRLVYAGCKAIGRKELDNIRFEAGLLSFP